MSGLLNTYQVFPSSLIQLKYPLNLFQTKLVDLESLEVDWYRDASSLIDVFEPTYIHAALTQKSLTLGSLIFGPEEWSRLCSTIPTPSLSNLSNTSSSSVIEDPLTAMFRRRGAFCAFFGCSLLTLIHLLIWQDYFHQPPIYPLMTIFLKKWITSGFPTIYTPTRQSNKYGQSLVHSQQNPGFPKIFIHCMSNVK